MKFAKRFFALLLALMMLLSACTPKVDPTTAPGTTAPTESTAGTTAPEETTEAPTETTEETTAATTAPTETTVPPTTAAPTVPVTTVPPSTTPPATVPPTTVPPTTAPAVTKPVETEPPVEDKPQDYSLVVTPSNVDLKEGKALKLSVIYGGEGKLTWTSSDETVATVKDGTVTAVKYGTATITVTDGTKTATVTVTVDVTYNLGVSSSSLTMEAGQSQQLSAYYNGPKKTLTWSSSDKSIATVSGGKIYAKKTGTCTITVTDGIKSASAQLTVVDCLECASISSGMTFNADEQYALSQHIGTVPMTFETVINISKSQLTKKNALLHNDDLFSYGVTYSISKSGVPQIGFREDQSTYRTYNFSKVNVATGEDVHLTITYDPVAMTSSCYVNGELKQTISKIKTTNREMKYNLVVGGDLRNGNSYFFEGTMDSVAIWSDLRTDAEIAADYATGIDYADKALLAAYDLARCEECRAEDLSASGNDLEHIRLWQDKADVEPAEDYDYSFAVVGDTQWLCENAPNDMEAIYDWILANQESQKIEYVIGLGDITNHSTDKEWVRANEYIGKLNGKIPYLLTRGNHDDWDDFNRYLHNGFYETTVDGMMVSGEVGLTLEANPTQRGVAPAPKNSTDYNTGKPVAEGTLVTGEKDEPEGDPVQGDLTNSYRYFSINGIDYLFLTLDFAPSGEMLQWANDVIAAHPNHRVIAITHAYMYRDGTTIDANDCYPPTYYAGYDDAQNGDHMWEKVFSQHENVYMVLSGHDPWQHIAYRQDEGVNGNTVTQMLIDPQYVDRSLEPTGMVAMFYFSNGGNTLTVRYYSVSKDCYGSELSQFTIDLT